MAGGDLQQPRHVRRSGRQAAHLGEEPFEAARRDDDQERARRGADVAEGVQAAPGGMDAGAWQHCGAAVAVLELEAPAQDVECLVLTAMDMRRRPAAGRERREWNLPRRV